MGCPNVLSITIESAATSSASVLSVTDRSQGIYAPARMMKKTPRMVLYFFYGSLMSGHYNNDMLIDYGEARKLGRDSLPGFDLFDLGFFPCAQRSSNPSHVLHGEVWEIDLHAERMIQLMEEGAGYKRELVESRFGPTLIWTRSPWVGAQRLESGDWNKKTLRGSSN